MNDLKTYAEKYKEIEALEIKKEKRARINNIIRSERFNFDNPVKIYHVDFKNKKLNNIEEFEDKRTVITSKTGNVS